MSVRPSVLRAGVGVEGHVVVRVAQAGHRGGVEYGADLTHLLRGQDDAAGRQILVQVFDAGGARDGNHVRTAHVVQPG